MELSGFDQTIAIIGAAIMAVNQGLKEGPEFRKRLPSFLKSGRWNYIPMMVVVIIAGHLCWNYFAPSPVNMPKSTAVEKPPIEETAGCNLHYHINGLYAEDNGAVFGPGTCGDAVNVWTKHNGSVYGPPVQPNPRN